MGLNEDNWKGYQEFKRSKPNVEAYYDLIRTAFNKGVETVGEDAKFTNAIDLGCGSGELTKDLLQYANQVTGVDSSPELINLAQKEVDQDVLRFVLSDVLNPDLLSGLGAEKFDLVTAAWLHNHLLHEDQQHQLLKVILQLLKPAGCFVFLIPSSAFTSSRTQSFIAQLGWEQAWLEESLYFSRGVYSFANSEWAEMNVWQPMWLANVYLHNFTVSFLDVKSISLKHGGMGNVLIEPPFDVMLGCRI